VTASVVVLVASLIGGCSAQPGASRSPSPAPDVLQAVCALPIVSVCDVGVDRADVRLDADADRAAVLDVATQLREAATAPLTVSLRQASSLPPPDGDMSPLDAWSFDLTPDGDLGSLAALLDAAAVPGVAELSVIQGWPSVTIVGIDAFSAAFDELSREPLFADGGSYRMSSTDEHLRIEHVAERTTPEGVHEVIALARDYPHAEVLLEGSPTSTPTLYVARLTPEEVAAIDARLRDPGLADVDVQGYAVPFVLGSTGADGVVYTSGTFGGIPHA
jgi:hypothetical protein